MKKVSVGRTPGLIRRRERLMGKLAKLGPLVRGSLCTARRGGHVAHQLTVSVNRKTHTVYVPLDMVKEVESWIWNYRQLWRTVEQISKLSMAIIHRHVPESQADGRRLGNRPRSR